MPSRLFSGGQQDSSTDDGASIAEPTAAYIMFSCIVLPAMKHRLENYPVSVPLANWPDLEEYVLPDDDHDDDDDEKEIF